MTVKLSEKQFNDVRRVIAKSFLEGHKAMAKGVEYKSSGWMDGMAFRSELVGIIEVLGAIGGTDASLLADKACKAYDALAGAAQRRMQEQYPNQ